MDVNHRLALITRNTQDIMTPEELKVLLEKKQHPKGYIGMAATGRIHIGYFIPLMKVRDFVMAGFHFTILIADIHAHLDDRKTPFELLDQRVLYYKETISGMLLSLGVPLDKITFVKGSDFELEKEYTLDVYRLAALHTFERCKRAAAEVVRFGEHPKLSGFLYPILQALDEQYLDVDVQYGGIDQRKILAFARESLPQLGYRARVEVMTPLLPGLTGKKMSSSDAKTKIDVLESEQELKKKVGSAFCPEGIVEENGVLAFLKYVVMVYKQDKKEPFIVHRPAKYGGDLTYNTYEDIESDFVKKQVHPMDLKQALANELNILLAPVRKHMAGKEAMIEKAFPATD